MKSPHTRFRRLPARLQRYLRGQPNAQPTKQREQWLDELVAITPDDDGFMDRELEAARRARILGGIRARTQPPARMLALWPALKIAAVVLFLVLAGAALWPHLSGPHQLHYVTGVGEHREIQLPNSSRVWLRPRSELTCTARFGAVRAVQLRGEAFFAVTKNPAQPFVVRTAQVAVQVLGTSFLVKAYPQLPATTVLVRTGRVQVARQDTLLGVLRPQEQLVYNAHTHQLTRTANEYTDALPASRMLTFTQASLPEILLLLENNYPIHFHVRRGAPSIALTGTLDPALSAGQIMEVLNVLLQRHQLCIRPLSATTYQVE